MDQQRTIWTVIIAAVVVILVVISAMAYQSAQVTDSSANTDVAVAYTPYHALTFDLNLPPINDGRYMLWAVDENGQYTLLKEFLVNESLFITDLTGKPLATTVSVPDYDLHQAVSFAVTIEQRTGTVTVPSSTVVLETKSRSGDNYTLTFPYDISGVSGSYQITTPTNGANTQETSGIWFSSPAGLTLPDVPTGWIYAAWLRHDTTWLPIGAFTVATGPDDSAMYSGPRSAPTAPGEDFLTNARDGDPSMPLDLLDGYATVFVTLQPANLGTKESREPYTLTLLQATIPPTANTATAYPLSSEGSVPSGVVRVITH